MYIVFAIIKAQASNLNNSYSWHAIDQIIRTMYHI